jgi:hypothetical protein
VPQTTSRKADWDGQGKVGGFGTEAAFQLGWDFVDRFAVSQRLYDAVEQLPKGANGQSQLMTSAWCDPAHFQPYGYTEFNNVLLNKLCDSAGVAIEDSESEDD